ncbi:N-acetylmuramoyl-L-alanine amidase [Calothrix sp. NIES-3974]|uniref:N-acetylmuramoyl-L-alanine amidase n=1 Tax=Calothrix sp. NIES-3974 TaxID=2005462 RepID=UPI000B5FC704|nr:N-acetylmuramoyl-L-alanine amidase [Calothrix sp. NIES-3974]BAZ05546.1 N-acetylmuramoyl-L-alanine amidase [Calothrix sp. NIES-3974]
MRIAFGLVFISSIITPSIVLAQQQPLKVVYPPANHQTSADRIFFIGSAPPTGKVFINGQPINRSPSGNFAPSLPLQLGENRFVVRYEDQELTIQVTRTATQPEIPQGLAFGKDSLVPKVDIARMTGEPICFSAIAPPNAKVSVKLADQTINLVPQPKQSLLPSNLAALTGRNQPEAQATAGFYAGCTSFNSIGDLGQPQYQLTLYGKTLTQAAGGKVQILSPHQLQVAEITVAAGVARTGPSTDYSRLTPLPQGTQAAITGKEGIWYRLDYGGWINSQETRIIPVTVPPRTIIRSVGYRQGANTTELRFPLQIPVPVSIQQGSNTLNLTLHNTTAQTDIIRTDDDPIIERVDWQQITPQTVQYQINLKTKQQWGYQFQYEGTTLVLSLRHPPRLTKNRRRPLEGVKILLDPGHGGRELGAVGPTGVPEKEVNLIVSQLLRDELTKRGANVVMTRTDDRELSLPERQAIINRELPTIALSVHYNSLPDNGDAENTQGVGMFWYHSQAHHLSVFLHNYLVKKLNRPSYGVFWNNLALTRPHSAPSVLLELGFMSNPREFEWITDPKSQAKLAQTLAEGITEWLKMHSAK